MGNNFLAQLMKDVFRTEEQPCVIMDIQEGQGAALGQPRRLSPSTEKVFLFGDRVFTEVIRFR